MKPFMFPSGKGSGYGGSNFESSTPIGEEKKAEWKCQSCGRTINHDPRGTAAICVKCGGISPLAEEESE